MKKFRKQKRQRESVNLKAQNSERAASVFMKLLALLPDEQQNLLLMVLMDDSASTNPEEKRETVQSLIADLDLTANRAAVVELLQELLPVEQLVPTVYEKYRPMVTDAARVILTQLDAERLRGKLIEQLLLPFDASLQERLLTLITRMPTLQKIGQIIARNRNLDPKFRRLLQKLENGIRDASYESILERVQHELKHQIETYKIKLSSKFLAEASVCAVVPFTWRTPEGTRSRGVFKVLKPFVSRYWAEELNILDTLAVYLDEHRSNYNLPTIGFREVLKEVRELLKREVKLPIEQNRLRDAQNFYSDDEDVRIPRLLPMVTANVTGMEFLNGLKVTAAANRYPERKRRISELILDKLIISVIFHENEDALFHADPHAGNIFYSYNDDELVLFDWGLSCTMNRAHRREIVQLLLGFILNDPLRVNKAACNLVEGKLTRAQHTQIEDRINAICQSMPRFPLVRLELLTRLLDELILDGIRFPAELLMFRKSLFTLLGVLHDVDPEFNVDWHLTRSLLNQILHEIPQRFTHSPWSHSYPSQVTTLELRDVVLKLAQIAAHLGLELTQLLAQMGLEKVTDYVQRFRFSFSLRRPISAKSEA